MNIVSASSFLTEILSASFLTEILIISYFSVTPVFKLHLKTNNTSIQTTLENQNSERGQLPSNFKLAFENWCFEIVSL